MIYSMATSICVSLVVFTTIVVYQWPSAACHTYGGPISDFIADHDVLTYRPVVFQHLRMKRSVEFLQDSHDVDPIIVRFRALGRRFHLYLHHDSLMAPDGVVEVNGVHHVLDHLLPVRGYVGSQGANSSLVYGVLNNGVFRGSIRPDDDDSGEYHIEAAFHYFNDSDPSRHSIIYHDRHVDWKGGALNRKRRDVSPSGACALAQPDVVQRMKVEQNPFRGRFRREAINRYRRSSDKSLCNSPGRVCSLYLQSDTFLWEHVKKKVKTDDMAISEITSLFYQHVSAARTIYSRTDFITRDKKYSYKGINFRVQRIRINTTKDCDGAIKALNPFCADNVDVINFLNLNAFVDHSKYCLAYVFTYRDFQRGTLGLAWVGDANNAGGICEKYRPIPEGDVMVKKSLNTGVVTLLNYGSTVSVRVSQSTFAHEMGHNFGATHDDDDVSHVDKCVPGASSPEGNYIMFSSATGGDKKHNTEFSSCSKDKIARQLHLVITCSNNKVNCLMNEDGAFCGNKLVELKKDGKWEMCDCGYANDRECKEDQCCYPSDASDGKGCTLKQKTKDGKNVVCSPTAGECCNRACQFQSSSFVCDTGDDCRSPSNCTGYNATCPPAIPKEDFKTTCNERTRTCKGGECIGSICAHVGLEECFIEYKDDDKAKKAVEMCYVACRSNTSKECISTHNLLTNTPKADIYPNLKKMLNDFNMKNGIQMRPGAPCDNYRGYCDVFSRCRSVDADGPLTRLKNLIFSPRTLTIIREWITQNWYYVIAMALGVILFMALFVKCCAVHTPSSNPNAPRARSFSETLRRGSRRTRTSEMPGNGRQPNARYIQHGESIELDSMAYRSGGGDTIEVLSSERGIGGRYTEAPPPYDQATPGHGHGRGRRYPGNQATNYHANHQQQKPQPKPRKKKGGASSKGARA